MISKKINKRTRKSPFDLFPKLIKWLATSVTKSPKQQALVMQMTDKILTILKNRGKHETIKYCKDLRLRFLKFIFDMSPEFETKGQHWFPKSFRPIISEIKSSKSYPFIRLALSCLYISRHIRLQDKDLSFKTIIERPLYKGTPSDLRGLIFLFLKDLGVNTKHGLGKVPRKLRFSNFHMSSKSGPNGHAIWTSYQDLFCLSTSEINNILILAGDKLYNCMFRFADLYKRIPQFFDQFSPRKGSKTSRRLSIIPDKEGKQREVAIVSYYEQAALLPLHKFLMKQLSRIDQDCTDNQTKLFDSLDNDEGSSYHSIDLTAFTDRFPIVINKEILSVWFGEEYAEAWRSIMVDKPFSAYGQEVSYSTGNPMGAYSSWASTTLAHHFFVWLACKRAKRNWKKCPYMLLGDDIVIANDKVALEYKGLLSEWCIEFSEQKTHTSNHGFEFAKQIRLHDQNVSPFPLSALYDRHTEPFTGLGILVAELPGKRWNLDLMSAVGDYYTQIKGWSFPYYKKKKPMIGLIVGFILYLQGKSDLGTLVREYVAASNLKLRMEFSNPSFPLWKVRLADIALETLRRIFKQNRDRITNPKTGGSLGDLSTLMVIHITSLRDGGADCFDLIEAVPFLQVYGLAEERFLQLNRMEERDLANKGQNILSDPSDFRAHFEKVDIPLQDSGFYTRHRDVIVTHSIKASEIIAELIRSEFCVKP